jgi:archaellum component FlaC
MRYIIDMVKKKEKLEEPATKGDLQNTEKNLKDYVDNAVNELATTTDKVIRYEVGRLDKRMDGMDKRMDGMDGRLERLEHGQEAILKVVQSIDEQLHEHKDLPARVARLERTVFRG